jgi:putative SOS response-associated peptidase YedK
MWNSRTKGGHYGRPFTFAGSGKTGKVSNLESGYARARSSQASLIQLGAQIHPRLPAILPEEHHAAWLGESEDGNLKQLLVPYPADQMRNVGDFSTGKQPKNDDPSLREPVYAEQTQTTADTLELLRE